MLHNCLKKGDIHVIYVIFCHYYTAVFGYLLNRDLSGEKTDLGEKSDFLGCSCYRCFDVNYLFPCFGKMDRRADIR